MIDGQNKRFTEDQKRLISRYENKVVDGRIYFYWNDDRNGTFSPAFNLRRHPKDERKGYFSIPRVISDQKSNQFTGGIKKIEMKDTGSKSSEVLSHLEKSQSITEENGKRYLEIKQTKPHGYLFTNFQFINTHWLQIRKTDDQVYQRLIQKGEADIWAYGQYLYDQIKKQGQHITRINKEIADVLKVLANETIVKSPEIENRHGKLAVVALMKHQEKMKPFIREIIEELGRFFREAILTGEFSEKVKKEWIPGIVEKNEYVSDELKEATMWGIEKLTRERDPLIERAIGLAKEYHTIEIFNRDKEFGKVKSPQDPERRGVEPDVINQWKERGRLSEEDQIKAIVDIANKKSISQQEAFKLALNEGVYLGRKTKYTSWQRANTRLNKQKK